MSRMPPWSIQPTQPAGTLQRFTAVAATNGFIVLAYAEVLAGAGILGTKFVQIHDAAAQPGAGTPPLFVQAIQAGGRVVWDFQEQGGIYMPTGNGISVAISANQNLYTAVGAGETASFSIVYWNQ